MRAALHISVKDLALRLRDRSVFVIALIAPLALAFIFNLVFGGSVNDVGQQITLEMGVVVDDEGPIGDAFVDVLRSIDAESFIDLTEYDGLAAADTAVEDGDVGAVFHIPPGMSESVERGEAVEIEVIGNVDAPTTTDIAGSIARDFATGLTRANLSAITAVGTGVLDPADFVEAASTAGQEPGLIGLGEVETEVRQLDSSTYFVAGLSIFFIFFVAGLSITSMLEERRDGTLARLIAAPISRASIVGGKAFTSVVIGIASLTVLAIASHYLMGAEWGPPMGVAIMIVTGVLAVVGIMTMVGGAAHTAEQAGNLQSVVAVTFGMLGGTFFQLSDSGDFLARLQYITPNAWFMRGLAEMASGDVGAAFPAAAVLMGMAIVTGTAGAWLARRAVRP